jgi:hypothetical protein
VIESFLEGGMVSRIGLKFLANGSMREPETARKDDVEESP